MPLCQFVLLMAYPPNKNYFVKVSRSWKSRQRSVRIFARLKSCSLISCPKKKKLNFSFYAF